MLPEEDERLARARTASEDEIDSFLYEVKEAVLLALIENPRFLEKHAHLILGRADVSSAVLAALAEAEKGRWMSCESVRLGLARHPHCPKRIAMAAVRQLFLFDLVRISLLPSVPPDVRRLAEETMLSRIPHLPIGEKLTLARRGPARIAAAILAEGHPQAIRLALANSFLSESQVLKVLSREGVSERVLVAVAKHPKWSCVYNVRVTLLRNPLAPAECVEGFLADLATGDLADIAKLRETGEVRKLIGRELDRREGKRRDGEKPKLSGTA
jgi:hypothetical protein